MTGHNIFYPTRIDEEAMNPDGSRLRILGACASQKTAFPIYNYLNRNEEIECMNDELKRDNWNKILNTITTKLGFDYNWEWLREIKLSIYRGWGFPAIKNSPYALDDE